MIKKSLKFGKRTSGMIWQFAKSENTLAIIKVAATLAAFIHAIEEMRKTRRQIGFRR